MTDDIDRAQAREAELLADALRDHARRAGLAGLAGLAGKTVADSAEFCGENASGTLGCGEPIAQARREAQPGCQFCVACQARIEKTKGAKAR